MKKIIEYTWGWITKEGIRCKADGDTSVIPENIIGVWGRIKCTGMSNFVYNESYLHEYKPKAPESSNWTTRPLASLLKANMALTYQMAHMNFGKLMQATEIVNTPMKPVRHIQQRWDCSCGHSFYTPSTLVTGILKRLRKLLRIKKTRIKCEKCNYKSAVDAGIVIK